MTAQSINSQVHQQLQLLLDKALQGQTLEQTQLNLALRLLSKWRSVLIQNTLLQQQGTIVMQGPLQGLDFLPQSAEGCHIAKLLGCYEQPLQPFIEAAIAEKYPTILNIGCAEGYYAVGMARRMPNTRLFNSPELRRQMGEAGRKRAVEVYDWKTIVGQYEALWAQQTELRLAAKAEADKNSVKPLAHPWPARMDPFHAFASYPTQALTPQTRLSLVDAHADTAITRALAYRQLAMVDFAKIILPSEAEIRAVLMSQSQMTSESRAALEWVQGIAEDRRPFVFRALAWLVKLGLLKVCP